MDPRAVLARFEAERDAPARMDHPNVARAPDAGQMSDGRPHFVMERVAGDPITRFCGRNHLSVERRLELLARVCDGVGHARQRGVPHRDIKPSNVLACDLGRRDEAVERAERASAMAARVLPAGHLIRVKCDEVLGELRGETPGSP